eukprot:g1612.t1
MDGTDAAQGLQWRKLALKGAGSAEVLPRCSGHTTNLVDGNLYVFGGCGVEKRGPGQEMVLPKASQKIYRLDLEGETWAEIDTRGQSPAARWHHTATVVDGTKILVFGGFHDDTTRFNDVWVFDTVASAWTQPLNLAAESDMSIPDKALKKRYGPAPLPRGEHSAVLRGQHLYVFGGYGGAAWSRRDYNDLCILDVD